MTQDSLVTSLMVNAQMLEGTIKVLGEQNRALHQQLSELTASNMKLYQQLSELTATNANLCRQVSELTTRLQQTTVPCSEGSL